MVEQSLATSAQPAGKGVEVADLYGSGTRLPRPVPGRVYGATGPRADPLPRPCVSATARAAISLPANGVIARYIT